VAIYEGNCLRILHRLFNLTDLYGHDNLKKQITLVNMELFEVSLDTARLMWLDCQYQQAFSYGRMILSLIELIYIDLYFHIL